MPTPHLDLLGLETFIAVAELGSFSRAAARLGVGQPALTRRLQRFESLVGCKLLVRRARPIQLSAAGIKLLPEARETLRQLERAVDSLHTGPEQFHIRIGSLIGLAPRFVVPALASHRVRWPQCHVTMHDFPSAADAACALEGGTIDFALTEILDRPRTHGNEVSIEEPLALVCPKSHVFSKAVAVSWKKLAGVPLISVARLTSRSEIEAAFARHDIVGNARIEASHVATALALVQAGCGLAILNASAVLEYARAELVAIPLVEPRIVLKIGLVLRSGWTPSPAARDLIASLGSSARTTIAARA